MPSLSRVALVFACAALPALGLAELGAQLMLVGWAPKQGEWAAIGPEVAALAGTARPVLIAPRWAEPLARRAFPEGLFPLERLAGLDLATWPEVVEVSSLGERAPETRDWRVESQETRGRFQLRRLGNPRWERLLYSFVDGLAARQALVTELTREGPRVCPWMEEERGLAGGLHGPPAFPRARHQCGSGRWFFAGVTVIEDRDYRPRRCIWAHPTPGGLVLRYLGVTLGPRLVGGGGTSYFLMRDGVGSPVNLEVRVDGALVGQSSHNDVDGWSRFEHAVPPGEGPRDVEIRVTSPNIQHRHFCFALESRDAVRGP